MIARRWRLPASVGAAICVGLALLAAAPARAAQSQPVIAAYSLAAPAEESASGLIARAVVAAGAECPRLDVTMADGTPKSIAMPERPRPARTSPAFDAITVCSLPIPKSAKAVSIDGRALPAAMPGRVDRLALFGDSGCRINGTWVQDCADPDDWPLARISTAIAREKPDAVIFNGDFYYRESLCPPANQDWCGSSPGPVIGMPFTDSAYGWIADVLVPMAPMLATAPLIVTRGNHEACYRGGNGYFYLFDPRKGTSDTCSPSLIDGVPTAAPTVPTPTYAIDLKVNGARTLRLAIVDSAGGQDSAVSPFAVVQRPAYERAAELAAPKKGRESWLLTHRPIYGYVTNLFATPGQPFNPWGSADQAAAAWGLLDRYGMVFSSHLHQAQVVQLPGLPGQLVLGNAGTELDPPTGYPLPTQGESIGNGLSYPAPSWAWVQARFGYAIAEPGADAGTWRITMRDPAGADFAKCGLRGQSLFCR